MELFNMSLMVLTHPFKAFRVIKEERTHFSYYAPLTLFIMILAIRIMYIYGVHFPLAALHPRDTNLITEMARMLMPLLLWTIGCYSVTTIKEGKTLLREQLAATAYAMLPYIVMSVPIILLTHILAETDAGLLNFLSMLKWIWIIVLFMISTGTMNDYNFPQTIKICILSIFSCTVIAVVAGLSIVLFQQLIDFVSDVLLELNALYYIR